MRQQAESDLEAKPCCDADWPLNDLAFCVVPLVQRKCTDGCNGKCMQMAHEYDKPH